MASWAEKKWGACQMHSFISIWEQDPLPPSPTSHLPPSGTSKGLPLLHLITFSSLGGAAVGARRLVRKISSRTTRISLVFV